MHWSYVSFASSYQYVLAVLHRVHCGLSVHPCTAASISLASLVQVSLLAGVLQGDVLQPMVPMPCSRRQWPCCTEGSMWPTALHHGHTPSRPGLSKQGKGWQNQQLGFAFITWKPYATFFSQSLVSTKLTSRALFQCKYCHSRHKRFP